MTNIWTARHTNKPGNPALCRASVVPNETYGWVHQHQCTRKPIVFRCVDGAEYGFCKQHDPETVKARDAARRDQWRLERERKDREYDRQKREREAMGACKAALEQIAAGHNDPRALAVETLALFPDTQCPQGIVSAPDE